MLPGFRFLFAAIILSMSILVFGLGAAALLRAAHEEFASNPTWRAAPEPVFAQQSEATKATLAMMRVDPPLPAPKPAVTATAFAPNEPAPFTSPETEKATTPASDASPLADAAKPGIKSNINAETTIDTPPAQAEAPVPAEAPASKVAAAEDAAPANSEPAPAAKSDAPVAAASETAPATTTESPAPVKSETTTAAVTEATPTTPPQATDSAAAAKKVAARGDAAAKGDQLEETKPADAKAEEKARLRAQRAKERRRLAAQRARLARQQQASAVTPQFDLQQATNPFALPTSATPPAQTKRAARIEAARTP